MSYFHKLFLLFGILVITVGANGQLNYKKGYIINNNGDTIQGKINDGGGYRNTKVCLFKGKSQKKAIKYYPENIREYRMDGDKYYVSRQIANKEQVKKVFVEVLLEGSVNLYHYPLGKKTSFYIEKENSRPMIGLTNEKVSELYQPLPDTPVSYNADYYLTNTAYLDTLSSVFRDGKKIQSKIYTTQYHRRSLMNLTKRYLREVCKGENCLKYEKDLKKYYPRVGIFTGVQYGQFSFTPQIEGSEKITCDTYISYPVGAFVNFPMPFINDRLSFQIEVMNHRYNFRQKFESSIPVRGIEINSKPFSSPVSLKYEIPGRLFSPTISIGKELYYFFPLTPVNKNLGYTGGWFGELGMNFKLYKKLSLFTNLRLESVNSALVITTDDLIARNITTVERLYLEENVIADANNRFATLYFGIRF